MAPRARTPAWAWGWWWRCYRWQQRHEVVLHGDSVVGAGLPPVAHSLGFPTQMMTTRPCPSSSSLPMANTSWRPRWTSKHRAGGLSRPALGTRGAASPDLGTWSFSCALGTGQGTPPPRPGAFISALGAVPAACMIGTLPPAPLGSGAVFLGSERGPRRAWP